MPDDTTNENRPAFSRVQTEGKVELRVWIDRRLVDQLDAEVIIRGGEGANVYRATVVNDLLTPWVEKKIHDANVVLSLAGRNPTGSEKGGDK